MSHNRRRLQSQSCCCSKNQTKVEREVSGSIERKSQDAGLSYSYQFQNKLLFSNLKY